MARLHYADSNTADQELRSLVASIREQRQGRLPNLYSMLLHSPPLASGWLDLLTAVRYKSSLDAGIRELVICLVARLNSADYEWQAHSRLAKAEGLTEEQLAALPEWRQSGLFDGRQTAVLAYAEQMTRQVEVDEETFAAVRHHFGSQQFLELTVTVAAYNMVSRLLVALQIDLEEG